jgi:hypothetical protein
MSAGTDREGSQAHAEVVMSKANTIGAFIVGSL